MANANCDECLDVKRLLLYKRQANFLCNDCEKYLCSKCITKHADHLSFALKDKSNKTKFGRFCENMMKQLTSEGHQLLNFTQERTQVCDIVDVVNGIYVADSVMDICILRESKQWAITYCNNKCIKVFNINNNQLTKTIYLTQEPYGITEIPSTDHSKCLIAVSLLYGKQIDIINIKSKLENAVLSITVRGLCYDLAYCNNKLITRCENYMDKEWHDSIHVLSMSGEIINIIDLNKLLDIQPMKYNSMHMSVHSKSETIYLCQDNCPSCVISLSLDGQILHYVKVIGLKPSCVHVDRDQTVYMMGDTLKLYKLSSDLSQKETVIDEGLLKWFPYGYTFTAIACHADTFYILMSDGRVVIIRHE